MNTERETAPRRKLSDARLRTLTQPGKYADGDVPGLYLEVKKRRRVASLARSFGGLNIDLMARKTDSQSVPIPPSG